MWQLKLQAVYALFDSRSYYTCYISRGVVVTEGLQTAKVTFKVIQGH